MPRPLLRGLALFQPAAANALCNTSRKRTFFSANYTWGTSETNTSGGFAIPANRDRLDAEWGPGPSDIRHRLGASFSMQPVRTLTLGLNVRALSGMPFNVTTGRDDNADGVLEFAIRDLGGNPSGWAVNGLDLADVATGLPPAAPGQGRVEPAALKGPAEVPFALTVADEEDLHSGHSTNPYHPA